MPKSLVAAMDYILDSPADKSDQEILDMIDVKPIVLYNPREDILFIYQKAFDNKYRRFEGHLRKKSITRNNRPLGNLANIPRIYRDCIEAKYEDISDTFDLRQLDTAMVKDDNNKEALDLLNDLISLEQKVKETDMKKSRKITFPSTIRNMEKCLQLLRQLQAVLPNWNTMAIKNFWSRFNNILLETALVFPNKTAAFNKMYSKLAKTVKSKSREKDSAKIIEQQIEAIQFLIDESKLVYDEYKYIDGLLKSLGIKILPGDENIAKVLPQDIPVHKSWYIINTKTRAKYEAELGKRDGEHKIESYAFHGAPAGYWLSIITKGLKKKPKSIGDTDEGWFGVGIYLSPDLSYGSTYSGSEYVQGQEKRYVGLYRAITGVQYVYNKPLITQVDLKAQSKADKKKYDSMLVPDMMGGTMTGFNGDHTRELMIPKSSQLDIYALLQVSNIM